MNIEFTGLQRIEYFKKFFPIDHIACAKISQNSAIPSHEVLVVVHRNGKNWIELPSGNPFAFAGIWEVWRKKKSTQTEYKSCAIITTRASASIRPLHHRMPVVLKPEVYDVWLDPRNQDTNSLNQILKTSILTEFVSALSPSPQKGRHQQLSLLD